MPRTHEGLVRLIDGSVPGNERILDAFRLVDRALFVPPGERRLAYIDKPVALPHGQTTSQPSLIAHMIDAAGVSGGDTVLEVGTGYGYQTALLAHLARRVVSVELNPDLAEAARRNLAGYALPVQVVTADGYAGVPEHAPYDAIVVAATAPEVPSALAAQLAEGGRLVIPLEAGAGDEVVLFVKHDGDLQRRRLVTPARFVPLVRGPR